MPERAGSLLAACVVAAALSVLPSCLYDSDQRCGPHQHLGPLGSCACDEPFVLQDRACVACGENEVWQSGACSCAEGFVHGVDGACIQAGAGLACDPTAAKTACLDPDYPVCRARREKLGYCSRDCNADRDCPHGFVCDTSSSPATCMTAPVGQGQACKSDADCAGNDANYCEVLQSNVCLVQGCSTSEPLSCSEGWSCCDLAKLGLAKTLCVPEGMCPTAM